MTNAVRISPQSFLKCRLRFPQIMRQRRLFRRSARGEFFRKLFGKLCRFMQMVRQPMTTPLLIHMRQDVGWTILIRTITTHA